MSTLAPLSAAAAHTARQPARMQALRLRAGPSSLAACARRPALRAPLRCYAQRSDENKEKSWSDLGSQAADLAKCARLR
jgi:hypothetical protein